jgi:tetraacyldisaccharide 4'-kinase
VSALSHLYGAATELRNRLYDSGLIRQRRLSQLVISVGNLSVGGSGKTPFVILLGELLKSRKVCFDVLSRGYARSTRGVLAVDPNGSSDDFGDEPLLIARRLACPVIVGESRYQAGLFAEKRSPRLHILDDGFQHRSLARDFDIVLLTPDDFGDRLLPEGRLREPLTSLRRADAVVLTAQTEPSQLPVTADRIWTMRRGISIANPPFSPVVFCGIARPQNFLDQLRQSGIRESATQFFRDHHKYSDHDIRALIRLRDENHSAGFITTEKDAINLGPRLSQLDRVAIAQVAMQLDRPDAALETLFRVVRARRAAS